ncbi:MAG TPA: response regulator transcription factor [Bacteroidia bacterium]|nr:response regulator transcription factor [Bacteroidia bacterium]HRH08885.1 response regulator transcription factor [Bacteroidia bacterium]HRH63328.1 response regulator transcription factor [Bacteroidia bacterium]
MPCILIADDHVIIRRGLVFLLDSNFGQFEIVEAESTREIFPLLKKHAFTHLILDMQLQDGNVMEIFGELRKEYSSIKILIYTMSPEDIFGRRMIQMGADGFLSKLSPEPDVINALRMFLDGKKYISSNLNDIIETHKNPKTRLQKSPFEQLSTRETAVLIRLLKGQGVKEISRELDIKSSTAATFKARLFDKLGVSNIIDLQSLAQMYNF